MTITLQQPCAIECEEAILGSILFDPKAIAKVINTLRIEDFYVRSHQLIYGTMVDLYSKKRPTDLIAVGLGLEDDGLLNVIGGHAYLVKLIDTTVSAVNIDRYAKIVVEKSLRRKLIEIGNTIADLAGDPTQEFQEILDQCQSKIFNLRVDMDKAESNQITLDQGWDQLVYDIENPEIKSKAIPTGIDSFDEMTGGLRPGELTILAGRPSMGKSWVGNFLALAAAKTRKPVLFFSAEMRKESLIDRFICTLSKIDLHKIINRKIHVDDRALNMFFDAYREHHGKFPIIIDDTNGSKLNMSYITNQCQKLYTERGSLGAIIVDYIQLIGDAQSMNRAQSLGAIAQGFKELSKDFDCPVVALAQINRGVEGRQDKRPTMADIKDSGGIEQAADVVAALYRDNYYNPETSDNELEIIVTKNRNGETGTAKCVFIPNAGIICNTRAEWNRLQAELLQRYP